MVIEDDIQIIFQGNQAATFWLETGSALDEHWLAPHSVANRRNRVDRVANNGQAIDRFFIIVPFQLSLHLSISNVTSVRNFLSVYRVLLGFYRLSTAMIGSISTIPFSMKDVDLMLVRRFWGFVDVIWHILS